ncbi:fimbrial protein [Enterobacter quasiroggenkampii]|uniref:fimbrial protein n=1 Tax=Enterobacter quasiroggenkampii TaxID=2497436 RepID=UPI0021CE5C1C|nr:fimbrial protein [Enterobacter quasiroggenkampii]MCU6278862.1 type 1 fimbrial protein [Enterobacter quasiroggenkampii]
MKRYYFYFLISCLTLCLDFTEAFAADPVTISITGKVIASPCQIDPENIVNNINFGDLPASQYTKSGSYTSQGLKNFHVKVVNCPEGTSSVTATFHGTPSDIANFTKQYKNLGTAQNVVVGLQYPSSAGEYGDGQVYTVPITDGAGDFYLQAYVMSTGQATPGTVNATVTMTFAYN